MNRQYSLQALLRGVMAVAMRWLDNAGRHYTTVSTRGEPTLKSCPLCDTIYEDYVFQCLVDGSDLIVVQDVKNLRLTPASTAAPLERDVSQPYPPLSTLNSEQPAPQEKKRTFVWIFGGVIAAGLLLLFATMMLWVGSQGLPQEVEPPARPVFTPEPPADPTTLPEKPPIEVGFTSAPRGAVIMEGTTELCTTPCKIPHRTDQALPRTFVLRHPKALDTTYTMRDPNLPQLVELRAKPRLRPKPRPKPGPKSPATPTPPPTPPAPKPLARPKPQLGTER